MLLLKTLDRLLCKIETITIVLALGVASTLNVCQVIARYFFNISFNTFDETSVYLMISLVFIGMARADNLNQNISVDIIHSILSESSAKKLRRISDGLLCAIAFLLAYFTFYSLIFSRMIGETSVSSLGIQIWPIMAVIPVSFFVVGMRAGFRVLGFSSDYQNGKPEVGVHI